LRRGVLGTPLRTPVSRCIEVALNRSRPNVLGDAAALAKDCAASLPVEVALPPGLGGHLLNQVTNSGALNSSVPDRNTLIGRPNVHDSRLGEPRDHPGAEFLEKT
jgi:hypothetical protein